MTTINYEGQELDCITEGYWPEGITVLCSDDGIGWSETQIVCLHNGVGLKVDGDATLDWKYWAILPPKPAPRRLTNREVAKLCRAGWDVICGQEFVIQSYSYYVKYENEEVDNSVYVRAPGSDEWVEPTSDLLEV